jgi:3-dehydroquinate synthase
MATNKETYPLVFDKKISPKLNGLIKAGKYSSSFIICDSNTLQYCLPLLISACPLLRTAEVIELEPGEESKDLSIVGHIWQTLTEAGADKNSLVLNLGGGVISDLGGFAASVFKRGIDLINVPTTLLSMADASVGGKTGINFSGIKNHIGTIAPSRAVFICTKFLDSLPRQHLVSGFAEIIKMGLIRDKKLFGLIEQLPADGTFSDLGIIRRSVELKREIVKKDPEEKGLRKILNFGHTVGHAIESVWLEKKVPMLHGEAVAAGMAIEGYLSLIMKRISMPEFTRIMRCLTTHFTFAPIEDLHSFDKYFKQDKKHRNKIYRLALLKGIGKCNFDVIVTGAQLKRAIQYYNEHIAHAPSV